MTRGSRDPILEQVLLPEPRGLTPKERALIEFLLDGPLGRNELRKQAETAHVESICSCGCPSVVLEVDRTTPSVQYRADETILGRTDWVPLRAFQEKARGSTEVTLHVVEGRLFELEIWAGQYGVRPRIDVTKLEYERLTLK